MSRKVNVIRRVVEYVSEEVNLLKHLENNIAEIYISMENKCVEIRFPTRVENYTHYVANVPFSKIDNIELVRSQIRNEQHMLFLEKHEYDIIWREEYSDTVTKP